MNKFWIAAVLALSSCATPPDPAADLAAIARLHEADTAAVLAADVDALLGLWTENPLALPPDGPILEGREAIAEMLEPMRSRDERPWETVEYTQDFAEVTVVGDYAWDLGTVRTRMVRKTDSAEVVISGKLLRILRREADGSWRVHRSAWNSEPPQFTAASVAEPSTPDGQTASDD